jgi:hypothetical protein
MNRTTWIRLERWYIGLSVIQQWLFKIGLVVFLLCCILVITREPRERPRQARIILDCYEGCGSDPERTIGYNEYMDRKEQAEKVRFKEERQRIQQEIWDERGRERWCRNYPQDRNCKK